MEEIPPLSKSPLHPIPLLDYSLLVWSDGDDIQRDLLGGASYHIPDPVIIECTNGYRGEVE
jgi:hypothetical protein